MSAFGERVCRALGRPRWLSDPRFQSNVHRNENREALLALMEPVLAGQTCAEALDALERHEVPCAPVSKVGSILDQLEEQGGRIASFGDHEFTATTMAHPVRISSMTPRYRRPPLLGEHTRAILDSLKEDSDGF